MHVRILITGRSDIDAYAGQIGTVVKTESHLSSSALADSAKAPTLPELLADSRDATFHVQMPDGTTLVMNRLECENVNDVELEL
jgi:hypothetical protein